MNYHQLQISTTVAEQIAATYFGVVGHASPLPGEVEFNFKITTPTQSYILKVSRPDTSFETLYFQDQLLAHLAQKKPDFQYPTPFRDTDGIGFFDYTDAFGRLRKVRLLAWIEGRLYSSVRPKTSDLRFSLGQQCGRITACLQDFNHALAHRSFDWDLNNALWVVPHLGLFEGEQLSIIGYFVEQFKAIQPQYQQLRKSTIHNDANDNNIVVNDDLENPKVTALIDYGDAVYSQIINDLSVALAYSLMDTEQPIEAATAIVAGYHEAFPLEDDELRVLYVTTAMRLVISVTKSALNKRQEPENEYLIISEKPAWRLLQQWATLHPNLAYYTFRAACGMTPCPAYDAFGAYAKRTQWRIDTLLPQCTNQPLQPLDLSVSSTFVGNFADYLYSEHLTEKIQQRSKQHLLVGGYGEVRPLYSTDAFKVTTNEGYEHRTIHIGIDFWTPPQTTVCALEDGEIFGCFDNAHPKDYGPTLILKHQVQELTFFTLYGHLTQTSLTHKQTGQIVKKGEKIGEIGEFSENGNWAPHLHFQVILDMLGHQHDFIGVSRPSQWVIFSSLCPDPNLVFKNEILVPPQTSSNDERLQVRQHHLGRSLSLSYHQPLTIVRGQRQFLIDQWGQKYLDTVNNVAHVGHEHPEVVRAGQAQMAVLNTNTRYLHDEILDFAKQLLQTFPKTLSVVHFVNSGSEANELALRMAKAVTGQKDIIALDVGYHGNTQACIDISAYKFNGKGGQGCPPHTHIVPLPDAFRGRYRGAHTGPQYAAHIQQKIKEIQAAGHNVAAFIAENIVSCGGQIDLPEGYLSAAYEYVRAAGGVCIADEVQVGFGRVGKAFWGFELHEVVPDIVTMGKPIGNGHPLAAVVCTEAVARAFANGMEYFNTFGGNPVSCAIGKKVLAVIHEEQLQTHALEVGEYLKAQLRRLQAQHPIIADIRGEGLFLGIELTDAALTPLPYQTNYLANRMKAFRILMSIDGPQHNVLKIKPPMCFSKQDADYLIASMTQILEEDAMRLSQ